MKRKNKIPKSQQEWIDQLTDPKGEIRREEVRNIRINKRQFKFSTHHTYRVVFADGEIRSAFTRNERQAVILTQAERVTGETDAPANYLYTLHVCMTSWL